MVLKSVYDVTGPDQVEFLARNLFQIVVVIPNTRNALPECLIFFLQAIVLLVEPVFFAAQAPEMQRATLADDRHQREQYDQRNNQIYRPTLGQVEG
ncbi:MAG TPA: hypothetical protein VFX54_23270 [Candidatus Binatia bacterium]|nr:hypothetical protein [Candidatus Binatia bacterium]